MGWYCKILVESDKIDNIWVYQGHFYTISSKTWSKVGVRLQKISEGKRNILMKWIIVWSSFKFLKSNLGTF